MESKATILEDRWAVRLWRRVYSSLSAELCRRQSESAVRFGSNTSPHAPRPFSWVQLIGELSLCEALARGCTRPDVTILHRLRDRVRA